MRKVVLIALLVLGAASLGLARPAPAISIDLAGNGSINVSNWTYGGDYTAHFCDSATISYPDGPNLSVLFVTNYSVSDGSAEYLDADVSGTSLTKSYDPTKGRLTISGVASVATYQQVLRTVYYVNTKTSPTTGNRDIEVQAFYGNTGGNAATCTVSVRRDPNAPKKPGTPTPTYPQATPNPTKDQLSLSLTPAQTVTPPYVDLSGGNGGPNYSTWTYGGSQYWAHICPNAIVSYAGTLTSATITLTNRPDGSSEYLSIQNFSLSGLSSSGYNPGTGQLTVTGSMTSSVCQALLRSIIYLNVKTIPNTSDRKITLKVSAGLASSNLPAVTMGVAAVPANTPRPGPPQGQPPKGTREPLPLPIAFIYPPGNPTKFATTSPNPVAKFGGGVFATNYYVRAYDAIRVNSTDADIEKQIAAALDAFNAGLKSLGFENSKYVINSQYDMGGAYTLAKYGAWAVNLDAFARFNGATGLNAGGAFIYLKYSQSANLHYFQIIGTDAPNLPNTLPYPPNPTVTYPIFWSARDDQKYAWAVDTGIQPSQPFYDPNNTFNNAGELGDIATTPFADFPNAANMVQPKRNVKFRTFIGFYNNGGNRQSAQGIQSNFVSLNKGGVAWGYWVTKGSLADIFTLVNQRNESAR